MLWAAYAVGSFVSIINKIVVGVSWNNYRHLKVIDQYRTELMTCFELFLSAYSAYLQKGFHLKIGTTLICCTCFEFQRIFPFFAWLF